MDAKKIASVFSLESVEEKKYGSGHINSTHLGYDKAGRKYIVQKINTTVFKNPHELMDNISKVTTFLRHKIRKSGGDPFRETMNIIKTVEDKDMYIDENGGHWRCFLFVPDCMCIDAVETPKDFYESAYAFGNFQRLLEDFPADTLSESIPNFHNTPYRFQTFLKVLEADTVGRAKFVKDEIDFVLKREKQASLLQNSLQNGELPLKVTHNDTKINNVLFDKDTRKGLCVIDLDTIMPGLPCNDFGDSIRFGANTAAEDETDLSKVSLDLELFETYARGFLDGTGGALKPKEIESLSLGAYTMTFECGMRFLTDYLDGDNYFAIHRENHNLDRCRTQFKLISDMESKWDKMSNIIEKFK